MVGRKNSPDAPNSGRRKQAVRISVEEAARRQRAYAKSRRAWAEAVGRPYKGEEDLRPPPGEVDAGPDE